MIQEKCKALILDSDPEALLTLQRTLENSGVDTTVTWDDAEARQLIGEMPFDVLLVGDHPPELSAETAIRELRIRGASSPCLILRTTAVKTDAGRLRRLGVVSVVQKRDPGRVLEVVQAALRR
jgi:CheY-like chemotaxis protein